MTKESLIKSIEELINDEDVQNSLSVNNLDKELAKAREVVTTSMAGVSQI